MRARKPYPEYRPSGVEWLGGIPAHWEIRRLKHVSRASFSSVDKHTVEGEQPVRLCNYIDVYYHDYITSELDFMAATATPEEIRRFTIKDGDVLVTKDSEEWDDIAVPAFVAEQLEGVLCGYHLAKVRAISDCMDGRYLFRAFSARGINDQFRVEATGITRYGLSKYGLDNALFLVPPLTEQRAIAAFLDRETARIDGLIGKKERQIELLQEKRAALISHAVIKGLDPNAKMKDSGVEWLGRIPAHWEVAPLYARYIVQLGKMLDAKRITGEHLLPYLRNIDVQWNVVNAENLDEMDFHPDERNRYTLKEGDLLICEGGEVGRTAIWRGELPVCGFQKAIHRVRPRTDRDLPRYFYYVMRAAAWSGIFIAHGNPNTIAHLTAEKLRVYRFAFPPRIEQDAIAEYLNQEASRIDALAAKVRESIATLREYRTALISAAVTGKIDVRGEAA
ncbi:MAG: restriction endonuclease subunit S [Planctomycetota bacterium]|nr:restriction endonuclease subunit S [Planctomycetota bacterium]